MSEQHERPLPTPSAATQAFWEACSKGVLEVAACRRCQHSFLPAAPCCPRCWSSRLEQRPVSGRGEVETFAIYRRTYHPALPAPYVVALIELEEGPRLLSNVIGCAPEEVEIGMAVEVRFEEIAHSEDGKKVAVPLFVPRDTPGRR